MSKPKTTFTLRNHRTISAVQEDSGSSRYGQPWIMTFIKEGERYVPLEELADLAFYDDRFKRWLKSWEC